MTAVADRNNPPNGVVGYSAYLPRHRLQHAEVRAALGAPDAVGARILAAYDEDATTMAVEATRSLISLTGDPAAILFATTTPPYLDKTNATAIHAAADLGHHGFAVDLAGSARSASGAMRAAAAIGGVAVMSDLRTGLPGSTEECGGADAAAAFRFGPAAKSVATVIGEASTTAEFLDRWRVPGELASHQWEERFGLDAYLPLIRTAARGALDAAGVAEPDRVVVSSPHARAAASMVRELPARCAERQLAVGYAGPADAGLRLAAELDRAEPGENVLVLNAVDGCDATVWRVAAPAAGARVGRAVAEQAEGGRDAAYATYLTWRGLLDREPPRRPEPERPAGPPSARSETWKFAFVGSACMACGRVHVPPRRVCVGCRAVDRMERKTLAGTPGTVATFTVDHLAYSPSPPVIDAVVDFDGGGRYTLEVTDASPEEVKVGARVGLTFRRLYTVGGVHNYFWKARPL